MFPKRIPVENALFSSGVYPLLIASLGLGTLSLGQIGEANIRIWEILVGAFVISIMFKACLHGNLLFPNKLPVVLSFPLVLSVALSELNTPVPELWIKQALLLAMMLVLFVLVAQRWSRAQILRNLRWVTYPGILIAGWGIIEMMFFPEELQSYSSTETFAPSLVPRARSLFAEANEFSQFLCLPFGFLISSMLYYRTMPSLERWVYRVGLIIVIGAQVLTLSRGGILAFAAEILAMIVLKTVSRAKERRPLTLVMTLLLLAIPITAGLLLMDPSVADITDILVERITALFSGADVTTTIRWDGIVVALSAVTASATTFVFGLGFGSLPHLLGEGIATTANFLVDIFSELGLLGLVAVVPIGIAALMLPLRTLKKLAGTSDGEMLAVFYGAYMSLTGLVVGGLTYATHMLNVFWFVCGLLVAFSRYGDSMAKPDPVA